MLPGFVLIPAGIRLAVPAMTTAIISSVDPARSGTASAVLNAARQVGGANGFAGYANETERFPKTENCFLQRKEPDSFADMLYLLSVANGGR